MWPELPIEFNVVGTPVSLQSENTHAKIQWKSLVLQAALNTVGEGSWAYDETRLAVSLFYFPQAPMAGDVDNIVKLVLDALQPNIYLNDALVDRVLVQRFDPEGGHIFAAPSDTLVAAMTLDEPVLYIKIADVPLEEIVP